MRTKVSPYTLAAENGKEAKPCPEGQHHLLDGMLSKSGELQAGKNTDGGKD